ncbi:MAG: hypothetical protein Q9163_003678 [Psora crenata]
MEHPSKRRRIERRVARQSGHPISKGSEHSACKRVKVADPTPTIAPKRVPSPLEPATSNAIDNNRNHHEGPVESLDNAKLGPLRLKLRQIVPTLASAGLENAVQLAGNSLQTIDNVAQPAITPVISAVHGTVDYGKQMAQGVGDLVASHVFPSAASTPVSVSQNAENAVSFVSGTISAPVPPTQVPDPDVIPPTAFAPNSSQQQDNVSPDVSKPVDGIPGLVSPLPAEAASAARAEALATQEALAELTDQSLPSAEGPPPPVPTAAVSSYASPNPASTQNQSAISIQVPDTTSQKPLSQPSTPVPQSPETTASPSTYFLPSQQATSTPPISQAPDPMSNSFPSPKSNSTTSASSTMAPSSPTTSILGLSTSSTADASVSTLDPMSQSALLSPSSTAALSQTSESRTYRFTASPTTFLTSSMAMTMASATSPSNNPSSGTTSSTGLISGTTSTGAAFGGTPTSGETSSASTSAGSGSEGGNSMPPTKVLVGGIVGGIAGAVLILVALLFLLRRRRGRVGGVKTISPPAPQTAGAGSAALGGGESGTMTQRSSSVPIAAAGFFARLRPSSSQTAVTTDTAPSERGFQKISGRKLPSVLQSGGDGYGVTPAGSSAGPSSAPYAQGLVPSQGPFVGLAPALRPSTPRSLSGSSFYRDSQGFYGGLGPADTSSEPTDPSASPLSSSPTFPAPPSAGAPLAAAGRSPGQSSPGIPNIRPGPARQPIINQGGVVPMRTPTRPQQPRPRAEPPIAENSFQPSRDPLGRSRPSQDGSRQSRFRESTTP